MFSALPDVPTIWISKLQSNIALSMMEAEYNALSMALRINFRSSDLWKLSQKQCRHQKVRFVHIVIIC
jgi:hypothetical protein